MTLEERVQAALGKLLMENLGLHTIVEELRDKVTKLELEAKKDCAPSRDSR